MLANEESERPDFLQLEKMLLSSQNAITVPRDQVF
jgi:hypothetical protein